MKLLVENRDEGVIRITRGATGSAVERQSTEPCPLGLVRIATVFAWFCLAAAAAPTVCEAQEADIPDENLRAAIEDALDKSSGEAITVEEMESLTELQARYLGIKDLTGLEHATGLKELVLWSNEIVDLTPLANLTSLETLRLATNRISDVTPLAGLTSLTTLGLPFNNVSDSSPLSGLNALEWLDLRDNRISDLAPLSGLKAMQFLHLAGNGISDLSPLSGLTLLDWIDGSNNAITDLSPLSNLPVLRILDLSNNGIADLSPLSGLTSSLHFLELASNGISDLSPLERLTNLGLLDLSDNRISDVSSLEGMHKLWNLDLPDNRISDLAPLAGMTNMEFLNLSGNRISDLSPLTGMNELDYLRLSDNEISDLSPLADLDTLSLLTLSANAISDLSALSDLKLMAVLHLADNQISDLSALSDLPELSFLYLSKNTISDLSPLSDLTELVTVDLSDNDISDVSPLSGTSAFLIILSDNEISDVASLRGGLLLLLDLSRNGMSDVSSLSGLLVGELVLSDNGISDVSSLSGLPFTLSLDLSDNQISDVSALSRLELRTLDLSNNRMVDLSSVEPLRFLETLDAAVNEIVDVGPAARLPSLQSLDLGGNAVADVMALASEPESLRSVSLWANPIDSNSWDVDIPAIRERGVRVTGGGWRVPFFPAPGGFRQGFARVVSSIAGEPGQDTSDRAWIYASGQDSSPSRLLLGPRNARHFNADDLVSGNPGKGLRTTTESEAGDTLTVYASADIDVLSYIRTADGFVTSMHDTVPWRSPDHARLDVLRGRTVEESGRAAGGHVVPIFNPASNPNQRSMLRLVNAGDEEVDVAVYAVDDHGTAAGPVQFSLAAHSTRTLNATELESGEASDLTGSLGDGEGKWRLVVSADAAIHVMNLLSSPTEHLTNLSTSSDGDLTVPMFPAASHPTQQGFVRVANLGSTDGTAEIRGYDDEGTAHGPLVLQLPANRTVHFNSDDWENGNTDKGLDGAAGDGVGVWRLEFDSELDLVVSAYVRTSDGFLTSMHDLVERDTCAVEEVEDEQVPARSERLVAFRPCRDELRVSFFNPASNTRQVSSLRLVNRGDVDAAITVFGVDDDGAERGPAVLSLAAGTARTLTSLELESGDGDGLTGALGRRHGQVGIARFRRGRSCARRHGHERVGKPHRTPDEPVHLAGRRVASGIEASSRRRRSIKHRKGVPYAVGRARRGDPCVPVGRADARCRASGNATLPQQFQPVHDGYPHGVRQVRLAADIGRRDDVRVVSDQRSGLALLEFGRHVRLQQAVGARRPAAKVLIRDGDELVAGGRQDLLHQAREALAVLQRAGRVPGHGPDFPAVDRVLLEVEPGEHFGDVPHLVREPRRRLVAKHPPVVLEGHTAAAGRGDDHVHVVHGKLCHVAAHDRLRVGRPARVQCQAPAAFLGVGDERRHVPRFEESG